MSFCCIKKKRWEIKTVGEKEGSKKNVSSERQAMYKMIEEIFCLSCKEKYA